MSTRWSDIVLFILVLPCSAVQAQPVTKYSGSDSVLATRWNWAIQETSRQSELKEFWIGYSIQRLMDEDSYIYSGKHFSGSEDRGLSLGALISGDTSESYGRIEPRHHDRSYIFKKNKDVALMFLVSRDSSGNSVVGRVDLCTMDLAFNLKGEPLLWLGTSQDDESVHLLADVFERADEVHLRKDIVEAVGIHQQSKESYPFLSRLLASKEPDGVRTKAAFWIAEQGNPGALKVLDETARNDRSLKVREQAVFAISLLDSDESTDVLIAIARKADDPKVRAKAAFWLGQKASQKVLTTLGDIIENDQETEVQRQALFALWQIKDSQSVDRLIVIARTHPNPRIRKQAVQILGQSDDPKALEALIEIVKK